METSALFLSTAITGSLTLLALGGVFIATFGDQSVSPEYVVLEDSNPGTKGDRRGKPTKIFIPNMLARWPWPRNINPNFEVVKKEADAWIMSFSAFSPKAQDAYNRCNFNLLACMACPTESKEHVRVACDLMHFFFLFDEHSDRSTPSEVRIQKDVVMDALRNPYSPRIKGEWIGGEVIRQIWERTLPSATAGAQKRFIQNMDEYLESIIQQSIDKKDHRILDIKSYLNARRCSVGFKPTSYLSELGLDIPDEVMSQSAIQEMILAAVDLIALYNDVLSYNLERFRGDHLHNIITCVMNEYRTDCNGAILWTQDYLFRAMERFHAAMAALPQWEEPVDSQVKVYCDRLALWIQASGDWSYESERYFGTKGLEIKENKWVSLLPIQYTTEIGPVHIDVSLL